MEERDGEDRVRRAWLRWLGVGTGSLALVMVALWTQRAPIAENFIGRELNKRGVRARYDLVDVGLRTQRIDNLVLGDPARPDLTAKRVEVDIAFTGLSPHVAAVRASGVRLRGGYQDGVLDLGELDRFRDPASTAPFSLPDLALTLNDARLSLKTDMGAVGMEVNGAGNLRSGFRGGVAVAMPRGAMAGCGLTDGRADLRVVMHDARPRLTGPVRASALACRSAATAVARPVADIDLTLGEAFDRWSGHVDLSGEAVRSSGMVLAKPGGRIGFDGAAAGTRGDVRLTAHAVSGQGMALNGPVLAGAWSVRAGESTFDGDLTGRQLRAASHDPLKALRESARGTPVGPLAIGLADAVMRAQRDNDLRTHIAFAQQGKAGSVVLAGGRLTARSGAQAGLSPDGRVTIAWPGRAGAAIDWALDGAVTTRGGGMPQAALRLARRAGGGFGGQLFVDPYAQGDARLALEPVRFTAQAGGTTHFVTAARLDGPLPDGRLRGLSLPVEGDVAANGAITINRRCAPLSLVEARYGGFVIGRTRQSLCPVDGALFAMGPRGMSGGADIQKLSLEGRSGDSPFSLTADHARVALGKTGFALANPAVTIGPKDAPVRFAATSVDGAMTRPGFGGKITGVGGQIGTVPFIVEQGAGEWNFAKGALSLRAQMMVRDSQAPARFYPLRVPDFALAYRDGRIAATGTMTTPVNGAAVARADIAHDLGNGRGHASFVVPDLTFDGSLQPEKISKLAEGLIANVAAKVTGGGRVDWTGSAVTSSGTFRTDNANLAAAFGPVTGLSGEIHFTDLINLVTAPGQEVRIKTVNPGVEVHDGVVRYHLERGQKVRIEGGGWPFSGGKLDLLPTTMNFGEDVDRYLTFRVIGLDAGAFVQAMELDNVSATGTFDGILPLIFNAKGGRVSGGVLVARQQGLPALIMPEGVLPSIPCDPTRQSGILSYVGPVSNEQVGAMGKMAFDALKNMQYKCLTILLDGALDGEMVTNVVFNGVNREPLGDAPAGIARSFIGLPFIFNVRIAAPFRGLLGTAQSFVDPTAQIRDQIGKETQEKMRAKATQGLAVQPLESDKMPNKDLK